MVWYPAKSKRHKKLLGRGSTDRPILLGTEQTRIIFHSSIAVHWRYKRMFLLVLLASFP